MKVTLHIGTEKTGTTSIQNALNRDRDTLAARGILYPRLFGSSNHMEVAVAAMDPDAGDELQMIELGRQDCSHREYVARLKSRLIEELDAGAYDQIVISNEHCHSRLRHLAAIRRIVELVDVSPEEFEIIVYLRRQDRLAVSLYSTRLKLGGRGEVFPMVRDTNLPHYYDFARLLSLYSEVFGPQRIRVRLYDRHRLDGGDVVSDFYRMAGLGIEPATRPRANPSLSRQQVLFLERFNDAFPMIRDGRINDERGPIFAAIRKAGLGEPFMPPRNEAEAFYAHFRPGNAEVRAGYFPDLDRETLFDEDFSDYPSDPQVNRLTESELMEFVGAIWRFQRGKGR